jgi:hypothetical protein
VEVEVGRHGEAADRGDALVECSQLSNLAEEPDQP